LGQKSSKKDQRNDFRRNKKKSVKKFFFVSVLTSTCEQMLNVRGRKFEITRSVQIKKIIQNNPISHGADSILDSAY
jgi:hypothetical protein